MSRIIEEIQEKIQMRREIVALQAKVTELELALAIKSGPDVEEANTST